MRYQVRAQSPEMYDEVVALLKRRARVVLELPRRNALAVEEMEPGVKAQIQSMGATVEQDYSYSVDPMFS